MRIDDGVYVWNCTVYSDTFKQHTQHAFFNDSHFLTTEKSACRGAIIDNRTYAPISVLEGKDRTSKATLNNVLSNLSGGTCIVKYAFKFTSHDPP